MSHAARADIDSCQTWNDVSDVTDEVDVSFNCVSATHSSQDATTATLSGQVDVTTDVRLVTDYIQQLHTQTHVDVMM